MRPFQILEAIKIFAEMMIFVLFDFFSTQYGYGLKYVLNAPSKEMTYYSRE